MSLDTWDTASILESLQQHAPLLTAVAVLAATYIFVKRIQQTGQCPFAGRPAAAGKGAVPSKGTAGQVRVCLGGWVGGWVEVITRLQNICIGKHRVGYKSLNTADRVCVWVDEWFEGGGPDASVSGMQVQAFIYVSVYLSDTCFLVF
jgi:hypothetical protein